MRKYTNKLFETGQTIIPKTMKNLKLLKEYKKQQIFYNWGDIVGKDIAKYIIPQEIKFSVLYVYAYSSVWANNFQYLKLDVIEKINEFLQYKLIKDIQFTRFKKKDIKTNSSMFNQRVDLGKCLKRVDLDDEEIKLINYRVKAVEDADLQNKLKKVYMQNLQLQKLKSKYGWINCKRCGRLTPDTDSYCVNCQRVIKEDKQQKIAEILQAVPWAKHEDIIKYVDCTAKQIQKVRLNLVQHLAANLKPDEDYPDGKLSNCGYSADTKAVVMLYKILSPDKLTEAILRETMKKLKYDTAYWVNKKKHIKKE